MRKTLTIVAAAATLSLLIGACGASGGSDDASSKDTSTTADAEKTTTTTEAERASTKEWASTFCSSLDAWLGEIQTASESVGKGVSPGDVPGLQSAVADLYGTMSSATKTLMEEIAAPGAPDIKDGDKFQEELIQKFEAVDQAALDAQEQIEAAPTDDVATFQAQVDELGTAFQAEVEKATSALSDLGSKYPSGELNTAINSACDF